MLVSLARHNPNISLQGTPAFMAVETQEKSYIFKGRSGEDDLDWFKFNYLHDLESTMWMFIWFIMQRIPIPLLPQLSTESLLSQLRRENKAFFDCGVEGSSGRLKFVQGLGHAAWPLFRKLYPTGSPLGFIYGALDKLITSFGQWYRAIESSTPVDVNGTMRWGEDVFKAEYHESLVDAFMDISKTLKAAYAEPVQVKTLTEYVEETRVASAKAKPVNAPGVEEGQSGDKRKRDGKDDGTAAKAAEATTNGRSRKSDKKLKV